MEAARANADECFSDYQTKRNAEVLGNQSGTRTEVDLNQTGNTNGDVSATKVNQWQASHGGFDDFFQSTELKIKPVEEQNQAGTTLEPVLTLKEAVEFYKISEKTIRLHIGQGKIPARKEQGPKGLEWRIYPSGIPQEPELIEIDTEVEIDGNQPGTSTDETWNHTGTSQVPDRNQSPEMVNRLNGGELDQFLDVIKTQAEKLEAANFRIGYLEAQTVSYKDQIKLLTDSQHKRGWWLRFCSWFIGER